MLVFIGIMEIRILVSLYVFKLFMAVNKICPSTQSTNLHYSFNRPVDDNEIIYHCQLLGFVIAIRGDTKNCHPYFLFTTSLKEGGFSL